MTSADKHAESWQEVVSVEDFVSYLRLLTGECVRPLGDDNGDPGAHAWTNRLGDLAEAG